MIKTAEEIFANYDLGYLSVSEAMDATEKLLIEAKIEAATYIYINFQTTAGGYCDEIGVNDIPNYLKELRELQQTLKGDSNV